MCCPAASKTLTLKTGSSTGVFVTSSVHTVMGSPARKNGLGLPAGSVRVTFSMSTAVRWSIFSPDGVRDTLLRYWRITSEGFP